MYFKNNYSSFFTTVSNDNEDPTMYIIAEGVKPEQKDAFIAKCCRDKDPDSSMAYYRNHIGSYVYKYTDNVYQEVLDKYKAREQEIFEPTKYRDKAQKFLNISRIAIISLFIISVVTCIIAI